MFQLGTTANETEKRKERLTSYILILVCAVAFLVCGLYGRRHHSG
jgi:hypothetical protein